MTRKECIDGMQRIINEDRNKILVRIHVGYLIHAVKYLKDQPEIVRCKDCKNSGLDSSGINGYWCSAHTEWHDRNWYCSDGERVVKQ